MAEALYKFIVGDTAEIKGFNDEERSFTAWASKESIDRDRESLKASGWDLRNFKKNPVVPLFHEYRTPPVAKALWTKIVDGDGLLFKPQFADTAAGNETYYLYREGFMNAFSVGFEPKEWTDAKPEDTKSPRRTYTKQELLEISCVVVPAHPEALVEALESGLIKTQQMKDWFNRFIIETKENTKQKGVIPYHDYGKAPESESWDGPGTIAQCDVAKLKKICTWYDIDNPDVKSSYKLPHHNADLKCVFRGVSAAMGRLNQTDIPEDAKKGCYNHLVKHYQDFDKEPPEYGKAILESHAKAIVLDGDPRSLTLTLDYDLFMALVHIRTQLEIIGTKQVGDLQSELIGLSWDINDILNGILPEKKDLKHPDIDEADLYDIEIGDDDDIDLEPIEVELDASGDDGDSSDDEFVVEVSVESGDNADLIEVEI